VDSYVSKPFGHLAIRPSPPNTDLRYTKGYPTRTGWWVGCSPATRRAAPRTRRAPCCTRAGRAACWPRAAPHPALGELCAGEVRVLHSRRAGRPLATRVGWSGAQPWSLGHLHREGPQSLAREEEGMALVEEELRGAGQQERSPTTAEYGTVWGRMLGRERRLKNLILGPAKHRQGRRVQHLHTKNTPPTASTGRSST
jgi:hypothetical protein